MGFLNSHCVHLFFTRWLPCAILVLTAIFVGWLLQDEIPEGRLFATVVPLLKGYMPATIIGHGKLPANVATPPIPPDMTAKSRPQNEILIPLNDGGGGGSSDNNSMMPSIGIGMCCRPTAYDDVSVKNTVLWFLLQGGRLIDTAHAYLNHKPIGEAVNEAITKYGIPREEIFITTKLWTSHYGYESTLKIVPKMLEELNLDYIDLILMHTPVSILPLPSWMKVPKGCKNLTTSECRIDTFKALSELRNNKGIVKNVGVSNFAVHHLKELAADDKNNLAPVAVNQIQYNPWSPQSWVDTFEYCKQNNIAVTAYNSLGGVFQHSTASTVDTLTKLSEKYDKPVSQIMLRWAIQIGAAIIPGTGNPKHMVENLQVYDFVLEDDDMETIDALRNDESAKKFFKMEPMD